MEPRESPRRTTAWLAAYGDQPPGVGWPTNSSHDPSAVVARLAGPGARELALLDAPDDWSPALAETDRYRIVFDGLLHNRAELRAHLPERLPDDANDADLVGLAYRVWDEDLMPHLKGAFALLIWDSARDLLLCARDPLGMHPLFYAETAGALLLSPSIETVLAPGGASVELDRVALVYYIARRVLQPDETFFSRVRRVPPGHLLRVTPDSQQVRPYWRLAALDSPIDWIPDDEAPDRFEALMAQAVDRCLAPGPAGIFLSGGIDSGTVARVAADVCRRDGRVPPWALSLYFGPDCDELPTQRGMADGLGLPQVLLPFEEATGPAGLFGAALAMTETLPAPLQNVWRPAYERLVVEAEQRGCNVILTGEGGDDWAAVMMYQAADLVRSLDVQGLFRLWRTYAQSHPFSAWQELRNVVWRLGARPLLADTRRTSVLRRRSVADNTAIWLAPDPTLRTAVVRRRAEEFEKEMAAPRIRSFARWEIRSHMDDPRLWMGLEEIFLLGRRHGIRVLHPFWDSDLIELLARVRPEARNKGGRTKALLRAPLAQRFPQLGFDSLRKSSVINVFDSQVAAGAVELRRALSGTWALCELGVVHPDRARVYMDNALASGSPQACGRVWWLLNVEAWTRAHHVP
jgi:asparagine synthase (glutamine-hydrolysing)